MIIIRGGPSVGLWITAELAAIMTDLAEFLGGAVGLNLLFHIPLFPAALLTGCDHLADPLPRALRAA